MPEAPEVSFLRDYISTFCEGRTLTSVKIMRGRYQKHGPPAHFKEFENALPLKLENVERRGKVLMLKFEKDWCIISKLGLTGWWYVDNDTPSWTKTSPNVQFEFKGTTLYYVDTLSYGTLTFTQDVRVVEKELQKLAPDVETTTLQDVMARLDKKKLGMSKRLLEDVITDQHAIVSGVGNYLKAEILYDAKISPLREVGDVTAAEWKTILVSAKKVIKRQKGNVSNSDGDKYEAGMRVYMRAEDPKGNKVEKHATKTGRTTFWVPAVQK